MSSPSADQPDTRQRLLTEARRAFAAKGFAKASTREICLAAEANIGLISYYFGDKAGLYREVLVQPLAELMDSLPRPDVQEPLEQWLRGYYEAFLAPLVSDDAGLAELMRIYGREMSGEATAAFDEACAQYIVPQHQALATMLAVRVGAAEVDEQIHQLVFALVALVYDYWMSAEHMQALAPGLLSGRGSYLRVLDRLVGYGLAMIEHERGLRAAEAKTKESKGGTKR
ncbi:CerR family C-terminal domain-containing protein [Pelomonas sp. SE-A7]|uniref:TetR/AcrR family transcriptional regulator n=1 Tax=Pelomonas sp. SE-A7 TaxID=3054953 RepID=UPI00259C9E93|nr:CerR family C-terminal domain-containing protein [Pelomonas sp. SE-A7]MDM4767619.1 CerR family C-terminal domain-containing protein [Pelomonas sp. SE-A7]